MDNVRTRAILPALNRCVFGQLPSGKKHAKEGHKYDRNSALPAWHGWNAARRGLGSNLYRDNTANSINDITLSGTAVAAATVQFTAPAPTAQIGSATKVTVAVKVSSSYSTPTGKITFSIDGKSVGSSTLASGAASLAVGSLAAGTHHVVAAYRGDKYHEAAKASETLTVKN